jgi:hypothetical protein
VLPQKGQRSYRLEFLRPEMVSYHQALSACSYGHRLFGEYRDTRNPQRRIMVRLDHDQIMYDLLRDQVIYSHRAEMLGLYSVSVWDRSHSCSSQEDIDSFIAEG